MSGAWPAVPVLEQAECWLAGLPMVTVPEMCFQSRDLRSEVFKEVQEELEGDEDDVTSNDEDYESDFVCEECEDCVKENVTLLECLNHVLEKCGEEPMVNEEWLALPSRNKMRVVIYVHNLRKQQLAEEDRREGEGKVPWQGTALLPGAHGPAGGGIQQGGDTSSQHILEVSTFFHRSRNGFPA
jgi:hypothetical protein